MLGLHRVDGSLKENPNEIPIMFSENFQNIFYSYPLSDLTVVSKDVGYMVVPHKVSTDDRDRLDKDFTKEEFVVALSSMQNW